MPKCILCVSDGISVLTKLRTAHVQANCRSLWFSHVHIVAHTHPNLFPFTPQFVFPLHLPSFFRYTQICISVIPQFVFPLHLNLNFWALSLSQCSCACEWLLYLPTLVHTHSGTHTPEFICLSPLVLLTVHEWLFMNDCSWMTVHEWLFMTDFSCVCHFTAVRERRTIWRKCKSVYMYV